MSQMTLNHRVVDGPASSAFSIRRGRHTELCSSTFVESTARSISRIVNCLGDCAAVANAFAKLANATLFSKLIRRDSHDTFERALEMKRADTYFLTQPGQCHRLAITFFNHSTNALGHLDMNIQCARFFRTAPQTGSEPGALRSFRQLKE